ncbi:MAG: DUF4367 domain-containing protein [Clostridiales bacterium]|nr:DUF4367 domain-containing protein [Clostridiales bacterium]
MSDLGKNKNDRFAMFDRMSTVELEEILRQDSEIPSGEESDIDAILYIMEVIARREKENPTGRFCDVHTAWESFKRDYSFSADDGYSIYDDGITLDVIENKNAASVKDPTHVRRTRFRSFGRIASIAAVIVLVIALGTATAYAAGFDLWGFIAEWTRETFSFTSSAEPLPQVNQSSENGERKSFSSLEEAVSYYDISEPLVPAWIPKGYSLISVEAAEGLGNNNLIASYRSESEELIISIAEIPNGHTSVHEKDGGKVTVHKAGNTEHYIMTNEGRLKVVWTRSNFECAINGKISIEEAQKMIDSIYGG